MRREDIQPWFEDLLKPLRNVDPDVPYARRLPR